VRTTLFFALIRNKTRLVNLCIFRDTLDPIVQNCVECYKSDWVVVKRRYQQYSSSVRTREELELGQDETLPRLKYAYLSEGYRKLISPLIIFRQEFELDDTPETSPEADHAVTLFNLYLYFFS